MKAVTILEDLYTQVDEQIDLTSLWPKQEATSPDVVFYAGSGELEILTQPAVSDWVVATKDRYPNAQHQFVSMACTSLHAAILEFERSDAQCAYVFTLEVSKEYLQHLLDLALGEDPDPISVHACAGRVILRKERIDLITEQDLVIANCSILAKPKGLMSDALLLKKLQSWIENSVEIEKRVPFVSFQVSSKWSDQLLMGFKKWVENLPMIASVLPSYEIGEDHYLAVKPLLEIERYQVKLAGNQMLIGTLGGGGRLGTLLLVQGDTFLSHYDSDKSMPIMLEKIDLVQGQVMHRKSPPRYCEVRYRNDNAYFFSDIQFPL